MMLRMIMQKIKLMFPNIFLMIFCTEGYPASLSDSISLSSVHSVCLYRDGWPLSLPIISQDENLNLHLSFDELSDLQHSFQWELIHCNPAWQPDQLRPEDFLEGFPVQEINDARPSFNTTVKYWAYEADIPGQDVHFLYSGNYILRVYKATNYDSTAFTRRFMVSETGATIKPHMDRPAGEQFYSAQELECDIHIDDASSLRTDLLNLVIVPDYRWHCAVYDMPLDDKGNGNLTSQMSAKNIFFGGNEFLNIDLKNLRYNSPEIQSVQFRYPLYEVVAKPDRYDPDKKYFQDNDLDGKYLIQCDGSQHPATEADYAEVRFSVPASFPFDGDLYVSGDMNLRSFDPGNKMVFNPGKGIYETQLLLKQGYYNYEYWLVSRNGKVDFTWINGSHFETENEYLILLYYKDEQKGYDRLIGHTLFNTLHSNR